MDLTVYMVLIAVLVTLAIWRPRLDRPLSIAVAGLVTIFSGLRQGGFDYDDYVEMIGYFGRDNTPTLVDALAAAKDPLFAVVATVVQRLGGSEVGVFLTISALAMATKVGYVWTLSGGRTLVLGLYAAFLAPGLEFGALRAAVAIGFLALATVPKLSRSRRILAFILAVGAHLSAIAGGPFIPTRLGFRFWTTLAFVVAATVGSFAAVAIVWPYVSSDLGRFSEFEGNFGTPNALLPPVVTMGFVLVAIAQATHSREGQGPEPQVQAALLIALGFTSLALGVALPVVTASTRFLEFSWFFLLVALVQGIVHEPDPWATVVLGFFLALLAATNVYRATWSAFQQFGVVGG